VTSTETIYALSSGAPPAAIAVMRVSGPQAGDVLDRLAGSRPEPRRAGLRTLHDANGDMLDRALLLWFPGPATATGEDLAELHLHGGRAVVAAVSRALDGWGLRLAEPGEFTRRALFNGRLDLGAIEGLADLLAAETEGQRREALLRADGVLTRRTAEWGRQLTASAARIEAAIDYDGEAETSAQAAAASAPLAILLSDIETALAVAPLERLRDGVRVAIIGPPNAGKSTLFNALVGRSAAIVSDIPGTTRDAIERPVSIGGVPFVLVDTAGLRETDDPVERIGVERARREQALADIIVDLDGSGGRPHDCPVIEVSAKADIAPVRPDALGVCALDGTGVAELATRLTTVAADLLPAEGEVALDRRHRDDLGKMRDELVAAAAETDILLQAEQVRTALRHIDGLTGNAGIEDMLDVLFGRFCLGK
jgi:tRNA modification GTPase